MAMCCVSAGEWRSDVLSWAHRGSRPAGVVLPRHPQTIGGVASCNSRSLSRSALCIASGLVAVASRRTHRTSGRRLDTRMRAATSDAEAAGGGDPWAILGLRAPGPGGSGQPEATELKRAFRAAARRAHPDAEGGSEARFRRVVEAYRKLSSGAGGPQGAPSGVGVTSAGLNEEVGNWGSFWEIENSTDDDDWAGREPLKNFFVSRHDAVREGSVGEGTIAIFRLNESSQGYSWGVGRILAVQVRYSAVGPNGCIHLQPLMRDDSAGGDVRLVEDSDADVATVRVVDRFEVVDEGLISLPDGSIRVLEDSVAYLRLIASDMVLLSCTEWEYE
mmetsp:Transcript_164734/g.523724  ORF Transcript_164734/g.523724 Transcript_164734/m.523724 type:complete len:332 (+) Transcript_164734:45-1040(+)